MTVIRLSNKNHLHRLSCKRLLKLVQAGLHREQKDIERLQDGFASCAKGHWTFAGRFCVEYKKALNVCRTVLRRVQKVVERLHDGFARVQKGLEVSSWGFCTCTKGYWMRECKINCVRLQQNSSITRLFYDVKRSNWLQIGCWAITHRPVSYTHLTLPTICSV